MNITLAFPPISTSVSSPPISLAALKAYLSRHDITSVQTRDLNIEFMHYILENWNRLLPILETHLRQQLEAQSPASQSTHLSQLLYIYLPLVSQMVSRIGRGRSRELLLRLLYDIITACYCSRLLTHSYFLRCGYHELQHAMDDYADDGIISGFLQSHTLGASTIVGFSLLADSQLPFATLLSRIIKGRYPDTIIIAGGPYISEILTPPSNAQPLFDDFDFLIAQEGESALCVLVESIQSHMLPEHPNIFSRSCLNARALLIEPITSLPTPDFSGYSLSSYFTDDLSLPIYSSKGCTWGRCKFCSQNSLSYREMPVDKLIVTLNETTSTTGVTHFQFVDENITPVRLKAIAEAMVHNGQRNRWFIQARLDRGLDRGVLELLKSSGCYLIEFGLESGSPETLRMIRKGITLRNVSRILSDCADLGYSVILNCMIGFPGETAELAKETLSFVDRITDTYPYLELSCNTQIVKMYTTCRYVASGEVICSRSPLSTVAEWKGPEWVERFQLEHGGHLLFNGRTVGKRHSTEEVHDPAKSQFTLRPGCYLVEGVNYDFVRKERDHCSHAYLVAMGAGNAPGGVFMLNDVMAVLVQLMNRGQYSLTELREHFINYYPEYEKGDIVSAFRHGIMTLNDLGALSYAEPAMAVF